MTDDGVNAHRAPTAAPAAHRRDAVWTAVAGLLALAVAMGLGRFAFTPLLPMMLREGGVDLAGASALATANYVGYWLGAVACALQPLAWSRWRVATPWVATRAVRAGLVATVLLTAAMAHPSAAAWPLWRWLAGLASAVVFVHTSGWCLARLTSLGEPGLAGLIYVGPGLGITVSGLAASAMVAQGWHAASGWAAFSALAAVLTAVAWPRLRGSDAGRRAEAAGATTATTATTAATAATVTPASPASRPSSTATARFTPLAAFAFAYGLAGFGYIVTATFLPVIARQALPGSVWLDLFWPLFGLGVSAGALATLRLPPGRDRRLLLAACYAMQAVGVLLTVAWQTLAGFALGSLLLGLPFTAITLFAMQEARRLQPGGASAFIGVLTAAYGAGQIAGPPLVALLARRGGSAGGFTLSLEIAAGALAVGAMIYGALVRRHPMPANAVAVAAASTAGPLPPSLSPSPSPSWSSSKPRA